MLEPSRFRSDPIAASYPPTSQDAGTGGPPNIAEGFAFRLYCKFGPPRGPSTYKCSRFRP
jgi:hypothetical protein